MRELELERMNIFDPMCVYLNTRLIHIELRNGSDDKITISAISCKFEMEDALNYPIKKPVNIPLPAGHRTQQSIQFDVGLELTSGSNSASVEIEYLTSQMKPKTITFQRTGSSIIIKNTPSRSSYFISHKIPEDTNLAQRLVHYLEKIGFGGYNAESDRQPGQHIWNEKIYPTIDKSARLIVLWTAEAEKHPEFIKKEIQYAKKKGKRIMAFIEKDTKPSGILPNDTEYFEADSKVSERNLVMFVRSIYNLHMTDQS